MEAKQEIALRHHEIGGVRRPRDRAACRVRADAPLEKDGLDQDFEMGVVNLRFDRDRKTRQIRLKFDR
jgi:hypothetical protein